MAINRTHGYVADIIGAIDAISSFIEGATFADLIQDDKTVSAVIRKFEIMGEAAKRVPETFKQENMQIPWSLMAKLRDKLIHHYADVDLIVLWDTIHDSLPPLRAQLVALTDKQAHTHTTTPPSHSHSRPDVLS